MHRTSYSTEGRPFDDTDSDDEMAPLNGGHRAKPRRKAHQKPQGSDQIRQAFSKRKKGLVLKSYQLYRLTDAKVFMFVCNDKGSSWAYSTPGFGAPLAPALLKELREMAHVPEQGKFYTEVMPHPPGIANHSEDADDRALYVNRKESLSVGLPATAAAILGAGAVDAMGGGAAPAAPPPRQTLPAGGRRGTPGSSAGGRPTATRSQTARASRATKAEPVSPSKSLQPDCLPPPGQDQLQVATASSMSMDCSGGGGGGHGGKGCSGHAGGHSAHVHPAHSHSHGHHMVEPPTPSGFYNLFASNGAPARSSPLSSLPGSHSSPAQCGAGGLLPAALPAGGRADGGGAASAPAAAGDAAVLPTAQRMVQRLSTENAAQLAVMLSRELAKRRPAPPPCAPSPPTGCFSQPSAGGSQTPLHLEPMCSGVLGGGGGGGSAAAGGGGTHEPFESLQARLPRLRAHGASGGGGGSARGGAASAYDSEELTCHSAPAGAVHPLAGGLHPSHHHHLGMPPHPNAYAEEEALLLSGFPSCEGQGYGGMRHPQLHHHHLPSGYSVPRGGGGGGPPFGGGHGLGSWPGGDALPGRRASSSSSVPGAVIKGEAGGLMDLSGGGGCMLLGDPSLDDPMLAALLEADVGLAPQPPPPSSACRSNEAPDCSSQPSSQQQQHHHHRRGSGGASPLHDGCGAGPLPRVGAGAHLLHGRSRLGSVSTSPTDPMPGGGGGGGLPLGANHHHMAAAAGAGGGGNVFDLTHLPPLAPSCIGGPSDLKRSQSMLERMVADEALLGSPLKRNRGAGPGAPTALDVLLGDAGGGGGAFSDAGPTDDAVTWAMQASQNGTVYGGGGVAGGAELGLLGGGAPPLGGAWAVMA